MWLGLNSSDSKPHRPAIHARFGAAGQHAAFPVDPDRLATPKRFRRHLDTMATRGQAGHRFRGHAALYLHDPAGIENACEIQGFLQVAAKVQEVGGNCKGSSRYMLRQLQGVESLHVTIGAILDAV